MEILHIPEALLEVIADINSESAFRPEKIEQYRAEHLAEATAAGYEFSETVFHYDLAQRILACRVPVSLFMSDKHLLKLITGLPCNSEFRKVVKAQLKLLNQALAVHKSKVNDISVCMCDEADTYNLSFKFEGWEHGIKEVDVKFHMASFERVFQYIPYAMTVALPVLIKRIYAF